MIRCENDAGVWQLMRSGSVLARKSASSIVVYALLFGVIAGGVLLPPLLRLLDGLGTYGGQAIVGNYSILPWVLSGKGLAWGFLLLSSSLFLLVMFFAGLFLLFAFRGGSGSLRKIFLGELWKRLPEILGISVRWSLVAVLAVLLLGVVPGLGFLIFLREHDINYYLKVQPAEWWIVIGSSAVWVSLTGFFLLRGLLRISLFFPLWVRGRGGLRQSVYESWALTRGHERRLALLLVVPVGLILLLHLLFNLAISLGIDFLLSRGAGNVRGVLAVIAGGALLFILEHFAMLCAGVTWLCAMWTLLCGAFCPGSDEGAQAIRVPGKAGSRALRALVLAAGGVALVVIVLQVVLRPPGQASAARTLVIAHRGGAGEAPENSVEAFRRVLSNGRADMVEMDVAMTSDGVLILAHDSDLMRQAGDPRKLAEVGWAEMSRLTLRTPQSKGTQLAPVARLEEALDVLGTNCPMIIEFKHSKRTPDLVARTVALVKERGLVRHVVFMSLDLADILQVQSLDPDARVGYFVSVEMGDFLDLRLHCLAPRHTLVTRKIVADARERGMPVFAWTVDDPVRVVELLELGVDGVITNEPTRVREVVDAYFMVPLEIRSLLRFRRLWGFLLQREEFKGLVDIAGEAYQP